VHIFTTRVTRIVIGIFGHFRLAVERFGFVPSNRLFLSGRIPATAAKHQLSTSEPLVASAAPSIRFVTLVISTIATIFIPSIN